MRAGGKKKKKPTVTEMNNIYLGTQAFLGDKHFLTGNSLKMTE